MAGKGDEDDSTVAFELSPAEWARVASRAQALRSTPYTLVLTCLQMALARVANMRHFLVHSVVSLRGDTTEGVIGNFQSLVRIDMRLGLEDTLESAVVRAAIAIGEAIEHCVVPAPLTKPGRS